jgi:hypothetical protein
MFSFEHHFYFFVDNIFGLWYYLNCALEEERFLHLNNWIAEGRFLNK